MDTTGNRQLGEVVDPSDDRDGTPQVVTLIDEKDMPSSSRSMSLLLEEAVAAIEKYPESEEDA